MQTKFCGLRWTYGIHFCTHFSTKIFIRMFVYIVLHNILCCPSVQFVRRVDTKIVYVFADKNIQNAFGTYVADETGCSDMCHVITYK